MWVIPGGFPDQFPRRRPGCETEGDPVTTLRTTTGGTFQVHQPRVPPEMATIGGDGLHREPASTPPHRHAAGSPTTSLKHAIVSFVGRVYPGVWSVRDAGTTSSATSSGAGRPSSARRAGTSASRSSIAERHARRSRGPTRSRGSMATRASSWGPSRPRRIRRHRSSPNHRRGIGRPRRRFALKGRSIHPNGVRHREDSGGRPMVRPTRNRPMRNRPTTARSRRGRRSATSSSLLPRRVIPRRTIPRRTIPRRTTIGVLPVRRPVRVDRPPLPGGPPEGSAGPAMAPR